MRIQEAPVSVGCIPGLRLDELMAVSRAQGSGASGFDRQLDYQPFDRASNCAHRRGRVSIAAITKEGPFRIVQEVFGHLPGRGDFENGFSVLAGDLSHVGEAERQRI